MQERWEWMNIRSQHFCFSHLLASLVGLDVGFPGNACWDLGTGITRWVGSRMSSAGDGSWEERGTAGVLLRSWGATWREDGWIHEYLLPVYMFFLLEWLWFFIFSFHFVLFFFVVNFCSYSFYFLPLTCFSLGLFLFFFKLLNCISVLGCYCCEEKPW